MHITEKIRLLLNLLLDFAFTAPVLKIDIIHSRLKNYKKATKLLHVTTKGAGTMVVSIVAVKFKIFCLWKCFKNACLHTNLLYINRSFYTTYSCLYITKKINHFCMLILWSTMRHIPSAPIWFWLRLATKTFNYYVLIT